MNRNRCVKQDVRRQRQMDNKIEVIGVDHGWMNMKTVSEIFTSGVKETTEPAICENTLEYRGKFYKVGGDRLEVNENKVADDNYYLLTLAAIAKELKNRKKQKADIILAVGIPLTKFAKEKRDFISYLSKNKQILFRYEKVLYNINLVKVVVFPQCYAAVADSLPESSKKHLVVDVGSWTIDIMPIVNCMPDESICDTQDEGLIRCINRINDKCVRSLNGKLDESEIIEVMRTGKNDDLPSEYLELVLSEIEAFAEGIYQRLISAGYNINTTPITFVGGGATVMRLFGKRKQNNIKYLEDIHANAKGFEFLANVMLMNQRG